MVLVIFTDVHVYTSTPSAFALTLLALPHALLVDKNKKEGAGSPCETISPACPRASAHGRVRSCETPNAYHSEVI